MYNRDIFKQLKDKFGEEKMPIICDAITELYRLLFEDGDKNAEFEKIWWNSAMHYFPTTKPT